MPNMPIADHPMVGKTYTYRPPYTPPVEGDEGDDDTTGVLVLAPGMKVEVRAVFEHWNGVENLTMCYVFVPDTGLSTHVVPRDLCDGLPLHLTTCPDKAGHM